MITKKVVIFGLALLVFGFVSAYAEIPKLMNYQGVLKSSDGTPYDGSATFIFSIWDDSTNGRKLWEEVQPTVSVRNGLFNVLLGSVIPIPDSVFDGPNTWISVLVNGNQLSPRKQIVSVGYAFTDGDWTKDGNNIYREQGNVGIGTREPQAKLDIRGFVIIADDTTIVPGAMYGKISDESNYDEEFVITMKTPDGLKLGDNRSSIFIGPNDAVGGLGRIELDAKTVFVDQAKVGIGTENPAYKLDVEGYVQAQGYYTGDIVFQKEKEKLWRMFEDEEGLYLENLKSGKVYRFVLQEVKK